MNPPLVPASSFLRGSGRDYTRNDGNPTWEALEALLGDAEISEIFVNGPHQILFRKNGALRAADSFFSSEESVALVVKRILAGSGVPFDAQNPIGEARLGDGTRVNAVHHAAAVKGPVVTLSRSSQREASLEELVDEGVLSGPMAAFLEVCVKARRNVVVCGGAGAGVGTLLHAVASQIPERERIVTVEQVARLKLPQPHVVSLEPRPQRGGGGCATSMRGLVANALRMRPDRLVVHEVSSGEAMELSIAMGGGQDGTLFSTYASSARDCLDRLETMILMAGQDLPARVLREQIANSLDVVVLMTRFADGSYRVTEIAEVVGTEVDMITTNDVFTFRREGFDDGGGVMGRFASSGTPPRFYEDLQRRGEQVDLAIFREG
jgi:pilus assembly protein CpaF